MTCHAGSRSVVVFAVVTLLAAASVRGEGPGSVEVHGGTAVFAASTNISAISIHGKSAALEGRAQVKTENGGLVIERLEASVPVKSLSTGMGLRDEHMRKYVFTTADGQVPDLRFKAGVVSCTGSDAQRTCDLAGDLTVRGVDKPFTVTLKVSRDGGAYRAVGDAVVKLSTYGISPPSQLGVRTEDDVKLHLDFTARQSAAMATGGDQ